MASGRRLPILAAYAAYQLLALAIWWRALAGGLQGGAAALLPKGSADPGQEVWFVGWLPHALGSGANPFFSHAIFSPAGVNLLSNTSVDLVGLLLSPVTVTAGPVAAFWIAVFLAPALSALGAFVLCRRHVRWQPAAFVGGLCYGFGPYVATDLRYGHLDLTWLVLPPLMFLCLDDLLLGRPRRPVVTGAALGLLVVAQFFVSTEMLAVTAVTAVVAGFVAMVVRPRAVLCALGRAQRGLVVAAALAVALLAYPLWAVVAGPRHFSGAVWAHIGSTATSLASTVELHGELPGVAFISGGNGTYVGPGLLAALVVAALLLRRSGALRTTLLLAGVAYVLSLGYRLHVGRAATAVPLPAAVLGHLPLLDSIVPSRFAAMVDLFCGVALALVVDHLHSTGPSLEPAPVRLPGTAGATPTGRRGARATRAGLVRGALVAVTVGATLVPLAFAPPWPYATATTRRPHVVASLGSPAGRRVPDVVVYPGGPQAVSDLMVWQAQQGFAFSLPNGYALVPGPDGRAAESPRLDALWLVFAAAELHRLRLPLSGSARRSLRADLRALGADEVVVLPERPGSSEMRRALTSVLGRPGLGAGGAAVWRLRAGA